MAIKIGSEFQVNTFTLEDQLDSSVASLDDGGFVVAWESEGQESDRGIYGQRYNANGERVGSEFQINSFTIGSQVNASVATLYASGFIVTWESGSQDGSENGIYGQQYNADGERVGSEFQINTFTAGNQSQPSVAFVPLLLFSTLSSLEIGISNPYLYIHYPDFFVTWTSDGQDGSGLGIYGQRYDLEGKRLGTEFRVNTVTDNDQFDSSIAYLHSRGIVVTWTSNEQNGFFESGNIYGQRYDLEGNPLGTEFRINSLIDGDEQNSSVASLADGGFVVAWQSFRNDDSFFDIYGQRYSPDGNPIGPEFRINTFISSNQVTPSVASLDNGRFVVTWTSFGQNDDFNISGIYGQEYNAYGERVGQEFLVNENTNGPQEGSSVASSPNDKFVVTWHFVDIEASEYNVYGQIFESIPSVGNSVFEVEKLARSGFISNFSFIPIEVNGLPLGSLYDETYYLSQNPDVAAAVNSGVFSNGYTHFVNFGGVEGRNPSTLYNEDFYLSQNPDVADAVAMGTFPSGSVHYALFGQQESRSPSELFDEQAYRSDNPDVNDAITNGGLRSGFEHFLKLGKNEGRLPNNFLYDESYYLLQNPDVAAAIAADIFEDGFAHYIQIGQGEGRNPSSLFNESQYLTLNPDVADAVNSDLLTSGFGHYILAGRAEGRPL